jgi:drug/metabolite transporter (DMT)-like permease
VPWRSAAICGALRLLGGNGGVVWAETMVDSGVAALLVGTVPLWMVCLDALRPGGGRPNLAETMGLLLGFAGVVVLVNPIAVMGLEGASGQAAVQPLGAGLVVFGALSWAIGSLYSRHANLPESPLLSTAMEMLTGGGLLLVGGLIRGEWAGLDIARFSRDSLLALVYLTTLGSLIAFSAYIWLLRVSTPAKVATYAYVNPVAAVLFGWAVLSEPLSARIFVAMALIVLAVVLITTYGRRTPTAGT